MESTDQGFEAEGLGFRGMTTMLGSWDVDCRWIRAEQKRKSV